MKIHLGVVGYGYWGPNLVRNLMTNQRCGALTVCDVKADRLEKAKVSYPTVSVSENYQELVDNDDIQGVLLATPISTHYELARDALERGKNVFVEKPLAHTAEYAKRLVDLALSRDLTLMVGHTFLFSPPVIKIREILKKGDLGKLYYIDCQRVNLGLHQRDVSVIWDLGPHDISMLLNWLDEVPIQVSVQGRDCVQRGIPDVCFMNMIFPSGVVVNLVISWLSPNKLRRIVLVGKEKMLVYDDTQVQERVKIYDKGVRYRDPETFGEYHLSYRSGDIWCPQLESYEPLSMELNHFIDCILTKQTPKSSGEFGWKVVKVLEAAEESLMNSGHPIKIKQ